MISFSCLGGSIIALAAIVSLCGCAASAETSRCGDDGAGATDAGGGSGPGSGGGGSGGDEGIVGYGSALALRSGYQNGSAFAQFRYAEDTNGITTLQELDGCVVYEFVLPAVAPTRPDAGSIELSVGSTVIDLEPDPYGNYALYSATMPLFQGGETSAVAAAGADVPSFTLDTVAPHRVTVVAPDLSQGLVIDRALPLAVAWQGASTGDVHVRLTTQDVEPSKGVECSAPVEAGELTISPEILGELPPGSTGFGVGIQSSAVTTVEGWRVALAIEIDALAPGGFAVTTAEVE
jgi:hypothetical protein